MRVPGLLAATLMALIGCGASDTPLGGPFGGTATVPPPNDSGSDAGPVIVTTTTTTQTVKTTTTSTSMMSGPAAPTWTELWTKYLQVPKTGCVNNGCHTHDASMAPGANCSTAKSCFLWIGSAGGSQVSASGGIFVWDAGGFMPKASCDPPTTDPQADTDFAAWIAAGAQDN
jgi:hypothetical protein